MKGPPFCIHYVSGSRADFGLMKHCLVHLQDHSKHIVKVVATGQHLLDRYGCTISDIASSGLIIAGEVPVKLSGESGLEMGNALADELRGFLQIWSLERPDLVLLLGDRGEMMAGALAAMHLGIHVGHLHGGERSGTLDENFRHAITKLSHLHFPSTKDAEHTLIALGEAPETIHRIGAPGLVGLKNFKASEPIEIKRQFRIEGSMPLALCVFHPVVQEATQAAQQIQSLITATLDMGYELVVMRPNSDAGGEQIEAVLDSTSKTLGFKVLTHLDRNEYLRLLAISDLLIGNSSSGIIESASFGVPCVNIGTRQMDRQRNANTFDSEKICESSIKNAISKARSWHRTIENVYGDGQAHVRLQEVLDNLTLDPSLLAKRLTY